MLTELIEQMHEKLQRGEITEKEFNEFLNTLEDEIF